MGDTVKPGQLLAKIDDFRTRNAQQVAQANVDSAQANLDKAVRGVLVPNAQDVVDQARRGFDKVTRSVDAQIRSAHAAEHRAEVKYAYDLRALRTANWKARGAGCDISGSKESNLNDTSRRPDGPHMKSDGSMDAAAGMDAAGGTSQTGSDGATPGAPSGSGSASDGSGLMSSITGANQAPAAQPAACTGPTGFTAAAQTAFNTALMSKSAYVSARNASNVAERGGAVTVEQARTAVVTARTGLRAAVTDRPTTIAQLAALVSVAQATLSNAQQDLRDTVLFSPVGGTVSAINGEIGEYVGSGSGTSAQSPGSDAPIPGVGAAASSDQRPATSDQAGNAAAGISATKPGGAAFVVLNNVNAFQVVVPFEDSDASRIKPNQQVEVSLDSVPGLERRGTVLSLAPNGVNISGVTNYYATVLLGETDPRLRSGMTAEAGVLVNQLDNVLSVPSSAVVKRDGRSMVNVPGPDGKPVLREFQPGQVGDDRTQVLSGLGEGQTVLMPQPTAPPAGAPASGGTTPGGTTPGGTAPGGG
ncbi:MAG TPA: hypothetical protein VGH99_10610 [Pseudonocardia sp.]